MLNSIFIYYIYVIVKLSVSDQDTVKQKMTQFVRMEIVCWAAGVISSVILISAIAYTATKLKLMYPG